MTPVLLDLSVCAEALAQRPERLIEKFKENQDSLHISAITASELYRAAAESLPADAATRAMSEIDRFIGRFQWLDSDFHSIRQAAMYDAPGKGDVSYQTEWNLRLARANGLVYVGSKEVQSDLPNSVPGIQIDFW